MKKGDIRRAFLSLLSSNYLLFLIWLLWWPINLRTLIASFSTDGMLLNAIARLALLSMLTYFLWKKLLTPAYELLVKQTLVERTVHINWAKHLRMRGGMVATSVKTCEIREGLSYHKPIPDDMIVGKRLTIGYLPKSCIILYVEKPKD